LLYRLSYATINKKEIPMEILHAQFYQARFSMEPVGYYTHETILCQ
jgi:hypothetical protein